MYFDGFGISCLGTFKGMCIRVLEICHDISDAIIDVLVQKCSLESP